MTYEAPRVKVLGSFREMTQTGGHWWWWWWKPKPPKGGGGGSGGHNGRS